MATIWFSFDFLWFLFPLNFSYLTSRTVDQVQVGPSPRKSICRLLAPTDEKSFPLSSNMNSQTLKDVPFLQHCVEIFSGQTFWKLNSAEQIQLTIKWEILLSWILIITISSVLLEENLQMVFSFNLTIIKVGLLVKGKRSKYISFHCYKTHIICIQNIHNINWI